MEAATAAAAGRGCLTCGAAGAGGAGGASGRDRLSSGERLLQLAARAGGGRDLAEARGPVCARCRGLLQRLHRAEERWLAARARFLVVLGRTPPAHPASLPFAPQGADSDDEPLLKLKADPDGPPADDPFDGDDTDDESFLENHESIREEYSCRECSSAFETEDLAALHALSIHNIDRSDDPGVIVDSQINNKKKKHSRKHKRKSLSENDDDDWILSTKKNKTKKATDKCSSEDVDVKSEGIDPVEIKTASQLQKKLGSNLTIKKVPYSDSPTDETPATGNAYKRNKFSAIGKLDSEEVLGRLKSAGLELDSSPVRKKKEKKEKKTLPCPECPSTFNSQARLDFHMVKHAGSKPPYICEVCGASYKHKKACDIHVGMHKGISPWKCPECFKIFPSKGALSRHEAIHTGTPNYQCDLCGKSFIHTSSFKMHKLSHSGLKPHTCTKCGLSLMTRSHLKRHQRVHSGEKRHECECCGKKFSERYNLYAHQRGHYGTEFEGKSKSHDCSVCEATFTRRHLLDKHMEVVHHRVIDTPAKRPRNTMSKHLKQQVTEPQVEIIEVKLSLSPTPQPQLKFEIPVVGTAIITNDEIIQRDIKPDIRGSELTECQENLEPPLDGQQPWDRIPSLANDYPLRMHGVDYAGYLNRQ